MICVLFLFALLAITIIVFIRERETFAGAMTQLYAKGPQDSYLTVGTDKYIPPYLYGSRWLWNMPTRLASPYYYPLLGIFPPYFNSLPYIYY